MEHDVRDVRTEWPMDSYLGAWKTFRQAANENESIASHLVSRASWPSGEGLRICDVGCGDGRLLETLILEPTITVEEVTLVDPDEELLNEAKRILRAETPVPQINPLLLTAEEAFPECAVDADVILLVHVVYLIESHHLIGIFNSLPFGKIVYVVFDEPTSVFTTLWEQTAPKYHERVIEAHKIIQALPRNQFDVEESSIKAEVPNPFDYSWKDVQDAILSILCYSSEALTSPHRRQWIESTIAQYVGEEGKVTCSSACYEIRRKN
jgi:2-polyprenyl-3-methyl-5-hydroxy-6-metoxy-1,4-benzoquinol methylase